MVSDILVVSVVICCILYPSVMVMILVWEEWCDIIFFGKDIRNWQRKLNEISMISFIWIEWCIIPQSDYIQFLQTKPIAEQTWTVSFCDWLFCCPSIARTSRTVHWKLNTEKMSAKMELPDDVIRLNCKQVARVSKQPAKTCLQSVFHGLQMENSTLESLKIDFRGGKTKSFCKKLNSRRCDNLDM